MRIAHQYRCRVHPVSTASNWGYGSALPAGDDVTLIDLSCLCRIIDFDPELGVVTLEPGVTQQMLADFLAHKGSSHMVPVTGAGPNVSLLANALERGYGITPYSDHFSAVTDVEAVLADGNIYRSALREAGSEELSRLFKWGIGPYTNGLFTQSGFGIVTRASILLARRPENVTALFFKLKDDTLLEPAVERVREVLQTLPGIVGGINLMNQHRVLAMTSDYPDAQSLDADGLIRAETLQQLGRQYGVTPWTGFATLYGRNAVVNAALAEMKRVLSGVASGLVPLQPWKVKALSWMASNLPIGAASRKRVQTLAGGLELATGRPNETALPLAYWRSRSPQPAGGRDPARDGCGLLWYAPLVPMRPDKVGAFVKFAKQTLREYGLEPLITLTSQGERLFDCTIPLLFDLKDAAATARAHECLARLTELGREQGFYPYRLHVDAMAAHQQRHPASSQLIHRLRKAWDPHDLMAPGRYA